jgi:hypothetical protein
MNMDNEELYISSIICDNPCDLYNMCKSPTGYFCWKIAKLEYLQYEMLLLGIY